MLRICGQVVGGRGHITIWPACNWQESGTWLNLIQPFPSTIINLLGAPAALGWLSISAIPPVTAAVAAAVLMVAVPPVLGTQIRIAPLPRSTACAPSLRLNTVLAPSRV